ncbi:NADPH-dependent FMN reductase [Actinocatenispora rupis]|uniref:NAD(P)H-dependent FMN reductase n=1 Tax=Actinocatenispora rupis TaxID=519421 RepID=A0A8J3JCB1_9ACTN|nr:NADPH-dependent FMN reductase [Actinocatenispora rupis]GID15721.1 NAD(P)H-dependent FMN reductase [Actinocatenispora rupis]
MASVLLLSGSPTENSRTTAVLGLVAERLRAAAHSPHVLRIRDIPPADLLGARTGEPAVAATVEAVRTADALVVGTPIYKAAYSGLLKAFLDLLPEKALAGKPVLPLATGGTLAHLLAVDYALRPVLSALRAPHVLPGFFVLDRTVHIGGTGRADLDADTERGLAAAVDAFTAVVPARASLARAS